MEPYLKHLLGFPLMQSTSNCRGGVLLEKKNITPVLSDIVEAQCGLSYCAISVLSNKNM